MIKKFFFNRVNLFSIPSRPKARGDRKENLSMFLFYVIRPWAEAHGYKGCAPSGRGSASHLVYLRKKNLLVTHFSISFSPPLDKAAFRGILYFNKCRSGGMADAMDSKSIVRKDVWVRLPPPV